MLKARTKSSGYGVTRPGADGNVHLLQGVNHLAVARQIGVDGNVAARFRFFRESAQPRFQRCARHRIFTYGV